MDPQLRVGDVIEMHVPRPWSWWQRLLWRLSLRRWRPREVMERRSFILSSEVSSDTCTIDGHTWGVGRPRRYEKATITEV